MVEGHEGFQWNLSRQEQTAGAADPTEEKYDIVTVTVTYPSDTSTPGQGGKGTVSLATIVDPPDLPKNGTPPTTGAPGK